MRRKSWSVRRNKGYHIVKQGRESISPFAMLLVHLGILAVRAVLEFAVVAPFADDSVH